MAFIESIPEAQATGRVAEIYELDRAAAGTLPNYTRTFSLRPEVYVAWRQLIGAIQENMDPRRYELATLAAARRLRSSYCSLAHGSVLTDKFLGADVVRALLDDHRTGGLEPVDIAVFELADKVARDATSVNQADIDRLRDFALTDAEILDVVLAAAARAFFSKALDGAGAEPDAKYSKLEPALREALTVGRPIADG
jgi:uncharacterized peroxidase-related enzyme